MSTALAAPRYTIDASVFVNDFNPFEVGHAESLELLTAVQASADPVIVPSLLLAEVASALARSTNDGAGALQYARAIARGVPPSHLPIGHSPAAVRSVCRFATDWSRASTWKPSERDYASGWSRWGH
jgi:predicted nucleic acid-binding protein